MRTVSRVNGLINDCGKIVGEGKADVGWFDVSTLKEPYRIEGKKTMGLELAEQFGWTLPDVILYPTGGGTGLIGMWKAFDELRPSAGSAERAREWSRCKPTAARDRARVRCRDETAPRWENPHTVAAGIRVPQPLGIF